MPRESRDSGYSEFDESAYVNGRKRSSSRDSDRGPSRGGPRGRPSRDSGRPPSSRRDRDQGRLNSRVRDSNRRVREPYQEEFEVRCAECRKSCKVPFKPNGSKPVLCSDCFRRSGEGKSNSGSSSADLSSLHEKLDKIMDALDIK